MFKQSLPIHFLLAFLLFGVLLFSYSPALNGDYLWDDHSYLRNNPHIRSLEGVKRIWFKPGTTPQYYPLVHSTYAIGYHFWKYNPLGYHLINVCLHFFSAILVWIILMRLKIPYAFFGAAIFAVHPVHVESVAWLTELKNVLSGVFYLLALLAYMNFSNHFLPANDRSEWKRWGMYGFSIFCFCCALLSKTVTCSLPVIILILVWYKNGRVEKKDIVGVIPFFVLGVVMALHTVWLEKYRVGAMGEEWNFSFIEKCLIASRAILFYLSKLFWPANLTFIYPRWNIDASLWWQYFYVAGVFLIFFALWFARQKIGRGPMSAMLFFIITLFPALGFFKVYPMKFSFVADHFQYLASLGPITLFVGSLGHLHTQQRFQTSHRYSLIVITLLLLAYVSWQQTPIYKNKMALYSDTIQKNPRCWMAYNNRGELYLREGNDQLALEDFQEALKIDANYAKAYHNRGSVFLKRNQFDAAMTDFNHALSLDDSLSRTYYNRSLIFAQQRQFDRAIADLNQAIALNPFYEQAYRFRARVYLRMKEFKKSLQDVLVIESFNLQPDKDVVTALQKAFKVLSR